MSLFLLKMNKLSFLFGLVKNQILMNSDLIDEIYD